MGLGNVATALTAALNLYSQIAVLVIGVSSLTLDGKAFTDAGQSRIAVRKAD